MKKVIQIIWREVKSHEVDYTHPGLRKDAAKAFVKMLEREDCVEEIEAYEVESGSEGDTTTAWFDINNDFERNNMDE